MVQVGDNRRMVVQLVETMRVWKLNSLGRNLLVVTVFSFTILDTTAARCLDSPDCYKTFYNTHGKSGYLCWHRINLCFVLGRMASIRNELDDLKLFDQYRKIMAVALKQALKVRSTKPVALRLQSHEKRNSDEQGEPGTTTTNGTEAGRTKQKQTVAKWLLLRTRRNSPQPKPLPSYFLY